MPMVDRKRVPADSLTYEGNIFQVYRSSIMAGDYHTTPLPMLKHLNIQVIDSFCAGTLLSPAEGHYKIQSEQLYLTKLNMLCPIAKPYPEIDGIKPVNNEYGNLFVRLPFTGIVTIGQPFIRVEDEIFVYSSVKKVRCVAGEIKSVADISDYVKDIQKRKEKLWQEYEEQNAHRKGKDDRLLEMYKQYSREIDEEYRERLFIFDSN